MVFAAFEIGVPLIGLLIARRHQRRRAYRTAGDGDKRRTGLEPATSSLGSSRSTNLSYRRSDRLGLVKRQTPALRPFQSFQVCQLLSGALRSDENAELGTRVQHGGSADLRREGRLVASCLTAPIVVLRRPGARGPDPRIPSETAGKMGRF